jgi:hypothetical protein
MADCDLPSIQPLLAVFDAAMAPIQPYLDFAFDQGSLDAPTIAEITAQVAPPALPALPGIIQALQIAEVTIALGDLPPMPALGPLPAAGFTINLDWDPNIQGIQLATTVVAMIAIPLDLIVGTLSLDPPAFPDIIIASLPDFPGSITLAECIEERLPMFG